MRAMLYEKHKDDSVKCQVCAHSCSIKEGGTGICGVRVNKKGNLYTLVGDVVTAINIDPIEKKPLYHFLPGSRIFSVGSAGCNFHCKFCQNCDISRVDPRSKIIGRRLTPETLVDLAVKNNTPSVAFTYNEPTVFFEQVYEGADRAKAAGLKTVLVSNGYMSQAALQSLSKRIDAANIDLKGFTESFYHKYLGARLQPVLDNLIAIKNIGWHLEVTTLVIPKVNDSAEELKGIANFIKNNLGEDTPWHVSAFHGAADMLDHPSTPLERLQEAWHIGHDAGLKYVYMGNVLSSVGNNTSCPECQQLLIERRGYKTKSYLTADGCCPKCNTKIPGVFKLEE